MDGQSFFQRVAPRHRFAWGLTLVLLVIYAVFTRFYLVTEKPLHHDESLFAYYAYFLARGLGYDYMPILHGPVLQYLNATFFVLFGDNQLTARLPAALGGLLLFLVFWFWRPELGRRGLVAAFLLLALSPSVTYYSRFLRNDVPYLTVTVWCALCLVRAFQTRRPVYVWAAILTALLMFSMMESSIFFFAACLGFLGLLLLVDLGPVVLLRRRRSSSAPSHEAGGGGEGGDETVAPSAAPEKSRPALPLFPLFVLSLALVALFSWLYQRIWADTVPVHAPLVLLAGKAGVTLTASFAKKLLVVAAVPLVFFLVLVGAAGLRRPLGRFGVLHQFLRTASDNRWAVAGAFAVSVALYTLLFTTFFTNLESPTFDPAPTVRDFKGPVAPHTPVQIYKNTWDYWWDQHKEHRIKGPFHFYLPILFLYELPALLIVFWGWGRTLVLRQSTRRLHLAAFFIPQVLLGLANVTFLADSINWQVADKKFHVTSPVHLHLVLLYVQLLTHMSALLFVRGKRVEAFVTFWMVTSLFAYSYAGEKVPWLTVHVSGPLFLLAGLVVGRLAREITWTRARRVTVGAAVCLAALWQMRSQISVAFIRPASPAERIIYNHTSPDVVYAVNQIREIAHRTNMGRSLPLHIEGEPGWPLYWYLRDMPNAFPPATDRADTTSRPVVIADWYTALGSENLRANYVCQRLKVREWWEPPMLDWAALADVWRFLTTRESRRDGTNAVRWQRSVAEWKKLLHYLAYREIWIDPEQPDWSNGANEFALCVRRNLDEEFLDLGVLDRLPKRPDVPRYP